jgi:hypothetical protein
MIIGARLQLAELVLQKKCRSLGDGFLHLARLGEKQAKATRHNQDHASDGDNHEGYIRGSAAEETAVTDTGRE